VVTAERSQLHIRRCTSTIQAVIRSRSGPGGSDGCVVTRWEERRRTANG